MNRILAHYRARCRADEAAALARAIAWEQTVEVVEAAVPWADVRERVVGRVEQVDYQPATEQQAGYADIQISYNPELAVDQITPLFNLAYGNVSLYPQVRLMDLHIPDALADAIGGPQFGLAGVRERVGVYERPLLCTAIKPRGAELSHLADIAYRYALGGGDVIKDDQNLAESDIHEFQRRVLAIHQALDRAAQHTGRRCIYFPHVTGAGAHLRAQLDFVAGLGIPGALFCPLALGFAACKEAAREYQLLAMYHPAFAGAYTVPASHGIAPAVLYGTFYRLGGADISIFLGPGGRVSLSSEDNRAIAKKLSEPLGQTRATLPCPAGGKTLELLPDLMDLHGPDALLLVGGALLTNDPDLSVGTRRFIDAIQARYPGRVAEQRELGRPQHSYVLQNQGPGQWRDSQGQQRARLDYQGNQCDVESSSQDFAGACRVPLVGGQGEHTDYELRYFELAPGAHTRFERHVHSHTVMVLRGSCELRLGGGRGDDLGDGESQRVEHLGVQDIAYIDTLTPHQLVNSGSEPCGFLCLVNRLRDRPQACDAVAE